MKYVDEFRDGDRARGLAAALRQEAQPGRHYRLMEFCGGHTHAVFRYGIPDLLPDNIELVHGPGCPVCVLPTGRLDMAMRLVLDHPEVILASYGDMLRVPGSEHRSLLQARADGADVRMVYSISDALELARANPQRQVVFFGIGFETTTPPTALGILEARRSAVDNFSVFCNHVLTPAAMQAILDVDPASEESVEIDGFIGPSHVSVIIGSDSYAFCAGQYHKPVVIAGFEPLDVLQSILMLVRQLNEGRAEIENQYTRAVTSQGNARAQQVVREVFTLRPTFEWRGLGQIPTSALAISDDYATFDAEKRFAMRYVPAAGTKGCECPAVLRGAKKPIDCKLFATACSPESPLGSCMVSDEGACAAYFTYGRFREDALQRQSQQRAVVKARRQA
ncbi:MAG: hydrogenase formation protein HypD [Gammaproteobacteria bacterium]|nr:hydrogenase formation protein HypD [Gammaproteobacteria bacterium]